MLHLVRDDTPAEEPRQLTLTSPDTLTFEEQPVTGWGEAAKSGLCPSCGDRVIRGQRVAELRDGSVVCEDCIE